MGLTGIGLHDETTKGGVRLYTGTTLKVGHGYVMECGTDLCAETTHP